jgi:hypothetical protein
MFQSGIQAGVAVDFVEILDRQIILRAFVLDDIDGTEEGGMPVDEGRIAKAPVLSHRVPR